MGAMVDVMHKGGPFMWLLLLLALSAPLPLVAGLVLLALRRFSPALLFWAAPLGLVLGGVLGRLQGHIMVREAVAFASPETQSQLLHAGIGVAAYTEWAGWGLAAALLSLSAALAGMCLALGAGPRPRWTPLAALFAAASGVLGLVGVVALTLLLARDGSAMGGATWAALLLVLLGAAGLLLAHLRASEDPGERSRLAAGRLLVLSLAVGGLLFAAMGGWLAGASELHEALAHASASTRMELLQALGRRTGQTWLTLCLTGAAPLLAGGLLASAGGLVHALRPRPLISGSLVAAGLLLVAAASGGVAWQAHDLGERTVERRLAWALGLVPALPRSVAAGSSESRPLEARGFVGMVAWQGSDWRPLGARPGEPAPWELPLAWPDGSLLVLAPGSLPAERLVRTPWAAVEGQPIPQRLLVAAEASPHEAQAPGPRHASVGMLEIVWVPGTAWPAGAGDRVDLASLHDLLEARWPEQGWLDYGPLVFVDGRSDGLAVFTLEGRREGLASAAAAVAELGSQAELTQVVLVPGASWTLQDLVGHCLAADAALPARERASWEPVQPRCLVTAEPPEPALQALMTVPTWEPGMRGAGLAPGLALEREATVLGALDKGVIQQVIQRHMNELRYCYQRELTQDPSLAGRVEVKFVVARDGTVSSASVASSTLGNQAVDSCIVGRFLRFRFPEPRGGGIVVVRYPFVFQAAP